MFFYKKTELLFLKLARQFVKAAECLYSAIVKKFDKRCTKLFHQDLIDTKNLRAIEILFPQPASI